MITRRLSILALLLAVGGGSVAARPITLDDLVDLVRLGSPRVAPDGKSVVLLATRPNYEDNRYETQLIRVDVASGEQRVLVPDRPAVRHPRWSAGGNALAFIANADSDGEPLPQVFLLPIDGGEARQVTHAPRGVVAFEWAGDDAFIYVGADAEPEAVEGPERHNKAFVVSHHDYLATVPPPTLHVWRVGASGGEPRRVNGDDRIVAGGILQSLAVSVDGGSVAFTAYPADRPGDLLRSELAVLDVETGARRDFGDALDRVAWGAFAPDGLRLAYSRPDSGAPWFRAHDIVVTGSRGGGAPVIVTAAIDRTFYGGVWMPNGESLLVGAPDGAADSIWHVPLNGEPRKLDIAPLNVAAGPAAAAVHAGRSGGIAFVASEPQLPDELYWLDSPRAEPRRLTDLNAAVAALDLGRVEEITWAGPDELSDLTENGMLIYPPGFDPARRYPLVLAIHGGPMGSSTYAFHTLGQLLAARGFVVFQPNYRGSGNLGNRYQSAVIGNAGVGPGKDVMAGLEAVKARGFVDTERIGVSGWSYGGYMTSWLIGNYPDVWRAAVAGAPVTDYVDQYALSDVNTGFLFGFEGRPWTPEGQRSWREQSPIVHAHKAKAPTLILCDTGDLRVPIVESYKLYHALDDRGVPVEFVAYPVGGHFPGDPVHVRDVYRRWGDWMERWLD